MADIKTNIFIPKKINVGFQKRSDTYTKKLAYIIYYDEKGNLRKEKSWDSWRDKKIDNEVFDNEPTSGFVLNKKAGGYSTGWNHRQTYVRVYDPRGFEFEINIQNLLYILENTNSIKGKGLEGDFIYGWEGKDLILIPIDSPDYKELNELNNIRHNNEYVKTKDLKLGGIYLHKNGSKYVYLGKFDEYRYGGEKQKTKSFFFATTTGYIDTMKSISQKFISVVSDECVDNYADLMHKLEGNSSYSPIDKSKEEYILYTKENLEKAFKYSWAYMYNGNHKPHTNTHVSREKVDGSYIYSYTAKNPNYRTLSWEDRRNGIKAEPYDIKISFNGEDEFIEKFKPMYLQKYLQNGRKYN